MGLHVTRISSTSRRSRNPRHIKTARCCCAALDAALKSSVERHGSANITTGPVCEAFNYKSLAISSERLLIGSRA